MLRQGEISVRILSGENAKCVLIRLKNWTDLGISEPVGSWASKYITFITET